MLPCSGVLSDCQAQAARGTKTGALVHDDLLNATSALIVRISAWVIDITEHWTGEGKLYLYVRLKTCTRARSLAMRSSSRMKSRLGVEVLEDAMGSAVSRVG